MTYNWIVILEHNLNKSLVIINIAIVRTLSVRLSVRHSFYSSGGGQIWMIYVMAWSKAYGPRIWNVIKKIFGIDPGRGQKDLKLDPL